MRPLDPIIARQLGIAPSDAEHRPEAERELRQRLADQAKRPKRKRKPRVLDHRHWEIPTGGFETSRSRH